MQCQNWNIYVINNVHAGRKRASECSLWKRDDCECVYCLDMKKLERPGRKKKCCVRRQCNSHQLYANSTVKADLEDQIQSTGADHPFDEPKFLLDEGRKAYRIKDDVNCMQWHSYIRAHTGLGPGNSRLCPGDYELLSPTLFSWGCGSGVDVSV